VIEKFFLAEQFVSTKNPTVMNDRNFLRLIGTLKIVKAHFTLFFVVESSN